MGDSCSKPAGSSSPRCIPLPTAGGAAGGREQLPALRSGRLMRSAKYLFRLAERRQQPVLSALSTSLLGAASGSAGALLPERATERRVLKAALPPLRLQGKSGDKSPTAVTGYKRGRQGKGEPGKPLMIYFLAGLKAEMGNLVLETQRAALFFFLFEGKTATPNPACLPPLPAHAGRARPHRHLFGRGQPG